MTNVNAQCTRVHIGVRDYVGNGQNFRVLRIEGFENGRVISVDLHLPPGTEPIVTLDPVTLEIPS
jgi:hypothetical protein